MREISYRDAIRIAMTEEMRKNENIFIIGEEVAEYDGAYKVTKGMLEEFKAKRVIDSPISEYGFTGLAIGASFQGLIPIVEFMSFNFSMQAIDHIINSAAKTKYMSGGRISSSIVFRGPNGSAKGVAAQHSQCFASWYASCPGLIVMAPYFPNDAYRLMKYALNSNEVVIFLEHELLYSDIGDITENLNEHDDFINAKIIKEGRDITIVSFSYAMRNVLLASEILTKDYNISCEIIDLAIIKPLDINTIIKSLKKTNKLICIENGWEFCGISAEIIAQVNEKAFDFLDAPISRICGLNIPMPYAQNLENETIPSVQKIVKKIYNIVTNN